VRYLLQLVRNLRSFFQFEGICSNPDEFLFWDDVHPTSRGHEIIGDFALRTLQEDNQHVPEPATNLGISILAAFGLARLAGRK
jgi:phospholipase/lecithinase/hemolysin